MLQALSHVYELHHTHKEVHGSAAIVSSNTIEKDISVLCDRLTWDCSDSLPLDTLAGELYISKYYLIRKCKRNLGLTPHKLHLQNRIRKAQALLSAKSSATEASVTTGFYDQSHFDRMFKKIVGISPTEYVASCKIL